MMLRRLAIKMSPYGAAIREAGAGRPGVVKALGLKLTPGRVIVPDVGEYRQRQSCVSDLVRRKIDRFSTIVEVRFRPIRSGRRM